MEPETKPLVNFRHFIVKYPRQPLVANFPLGSSRNFRDIFKAFRQPSLETWSFIFEIEHLLSYFCCDFFLFRVINDNNKLKSLQRTFHFDANDIDGIWNLSLFKNVWKKKNSFKYLLKYSWQNKFTYSRKQSRWLDYSASYSYISHPFIFYINFVRINTTGTRRTYGQHPLITSEVKISVARLR